MPKPPAMTRSFSEELNQVSSSIDNIDQEEGEGQAEDFLKAIFSKQATGFLELSAFPGPASAISLRNQIHYFAGPRNEQSQQQRFSTEVPSLLNTSTSSLLLIKGAP